MKKKTNNKLLILGIIIVAALLGTSIMLQKGKKPADTSSAPNSYARPQEVGSERPSLGIDYALIAEKLNLSEDVVRDVLTTTEGQRPNLEEAAATLGVSVDALREAMGIRGGMLNRENFPSNKSAPPNSD